MNNDKTAYTDQPIARVILSSDRLDYDKQYYQLEAERQTIFENDVTTDKRYHNYMLLSGEDFDNVRLNIALNSAKITSGNNTVMYSRFLTMPSLTRKARNMARKHGAALQQKMV